MQRVARTCGRALRGAAHMLRLRGPGGALQTAYECKGQSTRHPRHCRLLHELGFHYGVLYPMNSVSLNDLTHSLSLRTTPWTIRYGTVQ
jgi:hypothetical protein